MGPQVSVSCWNWHTAACRHPGFQMWGVIAFVFLLIELLMPHLSTSLKQSFLDAFRNLSLCGLSGLVSICGKGELACQEQSEFCRSHDILGFLSHRFLQFSLVIRIPRGILLFPLEAPSGRRGCGGKETWPNDSQFSENKKYTASLKGGGTTNNC